MKNIILIVLRILLISLMTIVLELNKNTIFGWILFLFLVCAYLFMLKISNLNHIILSIIFVLGFAIVLYISWPPIKNVPAVDYDNPEYTDILSINDGDIKGVYNKDKTVEVYTGIPYAKAPIGNLRWKEPQDVDKWNDTLVCDHFAPMSMQVVNLPIYDSLTRIIGYHDYKISLKDNYRPPVSEDSLYLNIWKPAGDKKDLPVLVYVHGGSLQTGQAWYEDYNGENLAKKDIIVVNMAYRLGVFGFYADEELIKESTNKTTGNYGLLDVIKSLEWVQDNIVYFGGDPNNVTLAGESAGSAIVSALCTSDLASGLFKNVIMESSTLASTMPPHSFRDFDKALSSGKSLKERYNCSDVNMLRGIKAEDIVKEASTQHHITIDGYVLKEYPYESYQKGIHNEQAILHGYNLKESGPFVLFDQANLKNYKDKLEYYFGNYTDEILELYPASTDEEAKNNWAMIYGALFFNYPHYCLNRLAVKNNIPVYEYCFSKENKRLGSWHSGEEIYAYDTIEKNSKLFDESDYELSDLMSSYWVNFVKHSNPNQDGLINWPENNNSKTLIEFDKDTKIIEERRLELYKVIDKMTDWED